MDNKIENSSTLDDVRIKFSDRGEKKIAKELRDRYLKDYTLETVSDKNTLSEIIYLEVIQRRLQDKLNEMYSGESKAVPPALVELIHKNSDAILRLKNSLGLHKSKASMGNYDVIQHLLKRGKKWREENQASRTIKCPECQKFVLLKIRTEAWEAQKHPFFKDNILYNKVLFEKYYGKEVLVDDAFIGEVLETSPDYAGWIRTKARFIVNKVEEGETLNESKEETETVSAEGLSSDSEKQNGTDEGSVSLLERKATGQNVQDSKG